MPVKPSRSHAFIAQVECSPVELSSERGRRALSASHLTQTPLPLKLTPILPDALFPLTPAPPRPSPNGPKGEGQGEGEGRVQSRLRHPAPTSIHALIRQ